MRGCEAHRFGELWDPGAFQMEGQVQAMRETRAGLAMVMSLSWMANARTSFVIVRIPVRTRNGLTSRSVGSNNMLLPVPLKGQEWHVVCQRVRGVFLFLVRSWWRKAVFGLLLGALCILGVLALLVIPLVCTRFGFQRCASCWTRPVGEVRFGEYAGQHELLPVKIVVEFVVFTDLSCTC